MNGQTKTKSSDAPWRYDAFPLHPNDATCGDCASFAICRNLFQCGEQWRTCDWSPSRFRLPVAKGSTDAE